MQILPVAYDITRFAFSPDLMKPKYTPAEYDDDAQYLKKRIDNVLSRQLDISERLFSYYPQIGDFERYYSLWQKDAKSLSDTIDDLFKKVLDYNCKMAYLGDKKKIAEAIRTVRPRYQQLLLIKQINNVLRLILDDSGNCHRSAVETYKKMVKECEELQSLEPPQRLKKLVELFKTATAAIDDQQFLAKRKDPLLLAEVTKLHLRTLEFFKYILNNFDLFHQSIDGFKDFKEKVDSKCKSLALPTLALPTLGKLSIDPAKAQQVQGFLDNAEKEPLEHVERFRHNERCLPEWRYHQTIGDVIEPLTKVKQSSKKLLRQLLERVELLSQGCPETDKTLACHYVQEKEFYEASLCELESRIETQCQALYAKPFSKQMHAGINNAAQREFPCIDIGLHIQAFSELAFDPDYKAYIDVQRKLLEYLELAPTTKKHEKIERLFAAAVGASGLNPYREPQNARERLYSMTYAPIYETIAEESERLVAVDKKDALVFETLMSGRSLQDSLNSPDELLAWLALQIARFFFYDTATPNYELDLALFALKYDPTTRQLYSNICTSDPRLASMIKSHSQYSNWDLPEAHAEMQALRKLEQSLNQLDTSNLVNYYQTKYLLERIGEVSDRSKYLIRKARTKLKAFEESVKIPELTPQASLLYNNLLGALNDHEKKPEYSQAVHEALKSNPSKELLEPLRDLIHQFLLVKLSNPLEPLSAIELDMLREFYDSYLRNEAQRLSWDKQFDSVFMQSNLYRLYKLQSDPTTKAAPLPSWEAIIGSFPREVLFITWGKVMQTYLSAGSNSYGSQRRGEEVRKIMTHLHTSQATSQLGKFFLEGMQCCYKKHFIG